MVSQDSELERVAWHEAGHVVVGHRLGHAVIAVSRTPEGAGQSFIEEPAWGSRNWALVQVAGYLAESRAFGTADRSESIPVVISSGLADESSGKPHLEKAEADASAILTVHWNAVERIAILLLAKDFVGTGPLKLALVEVPFGAPD